MKKTFALFLTSVLSLTALAQKDAFVGFYKGELIADKQRYPSSGDNTIWAEVSKGPDGYRVVFKPAIMRRAEPFGMADKLKSSGDKIILNKVGEGEHFSGFEGFISPSEIDLKVEKYHVNAPMSTKLKLKKVEIQSPTLGLKAPAGAIVLFDGKNLDEFDGIAGKKVVEPDWVLNGDGSMTIKQERDANGKKVRFLDLCTKKHFGSLKMHLEFKFPAEYNFNHRQARNNSGVIFEGMYEIQVLDSFGSEGYWDECGSVYRQWPPMVNACIESGAWQTMDIEFTPAVFNGDTVVEYPKATVYVNGVLVQKDTPFIYPTHMQPAQGAKFDQKKHAREVRIKLQDHTNPISFRNIWVLPR